MSQLSAHLKLQAPRILSLWKEKLRVLSPFLAAEKSSFLIDEMPQFLDSLSQVFANPTEPIRESVVLKIANAHGRQRAKSAMYDVARLISDYTLLRESVLSTCSDDHLTKEEALKLSRLLEASIGSSAEGFAAVMSSQMASEARFHAVFAKAAVGFAVCNLEGHFVEVNPRFCEIVGYTEDELQSMTSADLTHPEDRSRERVKLNQLITGEISNFIIEKRFLKQSGEVVWVRNSISMIQGEDQLPYVIRVAEDVTAVREADELRQKSEESYRMLANSMPQIVWTASADGNLDYFNDVWFHYSGTTHADNINSGWIKTVHPDDIEKTVKRWTHSLQTSEIYETEFRLRSKANVYRWFVVRALPALDELGRVVKWYGTNTDIHEFKMLSEELDSARRETETEKQKFQAIFAASSTSMALLKGGDYVYEIANKSYLELFNHREIVGKPFIEALPELIDQEFPKIARRVFESGKVYTAHEDRALLKRTDDGELEERFFDQSYYPIQDRDGKPYGVFIHANEVTEKVNSRRQIEESAERLRLALEVANMGTWQLDPKTGLVEWSTRSREIFGFPKEGLIPLTLVLEHIHDEDRTRVVEAIAAAIDPSGDGHYSIRYRVTPRPGEVRWLSLAGKSFFTDTNVGRTTNRFLGTVLDITDQVLAESTLREAKDRAELANAAKSSFLANMSHEIRTPLGAIMGFVSLIRDDGISQEMIHEYVSVIERNSSQLLRIIDDILDLSKVEAGMMLIEHIEFSLIELLSDFSSIMGFKARDKGINFELKAKTKLPMMIKSDPTRLRQILTNIVGNAIKFTEKGNVIVLVSFEHGQITFEVEDTGTGITKEQAENLFQPFSQGDVSMTRKYGGTGLGLVLTRRLSEALGGSFVLERSRVNEGSLFVASIKVEVLDETQLVNALGFASEPIRNAGIAATLRAVSILLVEDSLDNQSLFSIYLSRAGAKIDIASDGAQGCEMAMAENYDIVVMDVQMPVMDGIAAVKKLRAQGYKKPIIALTAHAMKEERVRCLQAGYTDFLSKPVLRTDLIDIIKKYTK